METFNLGEIKDHDHRVILTLRLKSPWECHSTWGLAPSHCAPWGSSCRSWWSKPCSRAVPQSQSLLSLAQGAEGGHSEALEDWA